MPYEYKADITNTTTTCSATCSDMRIEMSIYAYLNFSHVHTLSSILLLFHKENMIVEVKLQLLVAIVDAKLLETANGHSSMIMFSNERHSFKM
jgi:hypothetical protein